MSDVKNSGPSFGQDLVLCDHCNTTNSSYSSLPQTFSGPGANNNLFFGVRNFVVIDYAVFACTLGALRARTRFPG